MVVHFIPLDMQHDCILKVLIFGIGPTPLVNPGNLPHALKVYSILLWFIYIYTHLNCLHAKFNLRADLKIWGRSDLLALLYMIFVTFPGE